MGQLVEVVGNVSVFGCLLLPKHTDGELTELNVSGFVNGTERRPYFRRCVAVDDMVDLVVSESDENLFGGGKVEVYPTRDGGIRVRTQGFRDGTVRDVVRLFVFEDGCDMSLPGKPIVEVCA
jgi:hypothetical protein